MWLQGRLLWAIMHAKSHGQALTVVDVTSNLGQVTYKRKQKKQL